MIKRIIFITTFIPLSIYAKGIKKSPNIVFILADDLGYSDLGFIGHKDVHTPNINRLANEGLYFSDAYSAAPVSSPTRASIITGKSPAELKLTCHIPGMGMQTYINKMSKGKIYKEAFFIDHLSTHEKTIGTLLKDYGYNTVFIGKWHLAGEGSVKTSDGIVNSEWHPDKYGFDINLGGCSYGQPAQYFSPYKNGTLADGEKGEYLTDRLGNEAANYIRSHQPKLTGKPFFLYLSFYAVHTPYQVPEYAVKANGGNKYFGLIQKLDENVGKILSTLKETGLDENTLIIFYSDNGGVFENPPLRGVKGEILEGGIRVPLIVRWPNVVKPNTKCRIPVTSIDIYATFDELINGKGKSNNREGQSIIPLMKGKLVNWRNRPLFWHYPHNRNGVKYSMSAAIREGDWKLIYSFEREQYELFNLKNDISEQHDLAQQYPILAKKMYKKLTEWQKHIGAEMPIKQE